MPPQLTRVLPLLGEGHLYLRWQVNNRGRRQLEGVGEAHLSPGGASRLHLLLLRRQTEHTDAQVRHMGHKTVDARDGWTSEAPEGGGGGGGGDAGAGGSPSRRPRPLCLPRSLRPARRRSTPTRRPQSCAGARWNPERDVPAASRPNNFQVTFL